MGPTKRKRVVTEALLRHAMHEDFASLNKAVQKLWERVADGDMQALEFVTSYLDGKPVSVVDMTHEVGDNTLESLRALSEPQRIQRLASLLHLANSRIVDVTPITPAITDTSVDDLL